MKPELDLSLYLITDTAALEAPDFDNRMRACLENGVTLVQLREKAGSTRRMIERARRLKALCAPYHVPLIIDDRVDVALAADAAGVHVGAEDMPVAAARRLIGPDKIVGATAKTVETARLAEKDGADYLGTGAIYPTTTKVVTVITSIETLSDVCRTVTIPVGAIGGLNADNIGILKDTGIAGICVVTALMAAADPAAETIRLRQRLTELGIR